MKQYLDLLRHIRDNGTEKADRTGTGTRSIFGYQMRLDLGAGFPVLTTKKIFLKGVIYELLWFLRGDTNIAWLNEHDVHIWDEWADENGDLGPIYGKQWRAWDSYSDVSLGSGLPESSTQIDQIQQIVDTLNNNPTCRRNMLCAWNVADVPKMKMPPCHCLSQFHVADDRLSCQLYQRSADVFLGVPFNISSYALLTMMLAHVTGLKLGDFVHTFGDVHIYNNHFEQVEEQLSRKTRPLPTMSLSPDVKSIFDFKYEDFRLRNYDPHPPIKAEVSV